MASTTGERLANVMASTTGGRLEDDWRTTGDQDWRPRLADDWRMTGGPQLADVMTSTTGGRYGIHDWRMTGDQAIKDNKKLNQVIWFSFFMSKTRPLPAWSSRTTLITFPTAKADVIMESAEADTFLIVKGR